MILTYTAKEQDRGREVYSILRHEMHISATLVRRLKAAGGIRVSGNEVFVNFALSPGDTITADVAAAEPPCGNVPEDGPLDILFETAGLIAVSKPPGVIVHPSRAKNNGTLANVIAGYLVQKGGGDSCHAVNRLDRDTTGVVLFAKNSHMKARAAAALSDESAVKEYLALAHGAIPGSGVIDLPIRRLEERNMLRVVSHDGLCAVTHYETMDTFRAEEGAVTLVRLRLLTGRTHQIRVHLAHLGYPILGDVLYGTADSRRLSGSLGIKTQALHAKMLGFTEPISGEFVRIAAPEPQIFADILK